MQPPKTIGVVGHGHFGKFIVKLAGRFWPEAAVRVYSRRAEADDEQFFSLEDTAKSDLVFLTGAIREYEEQLKSLLPHLGSETVVVDVATVKKHTSDLFKTHADDRRYICCHPMFGAESYQKTRGDVTGYRIVVTNHTLPAIAYEALKAFLTELGFVVVEMSVDEHDRLLAETLFLTHYVGQTMSTGGFGRTSLDSVSFASLMNAVESVQNDIKLFHDVYRFNPYCQAVADRFHQAQETVFKNLPPD